MSMDLYKDDNRNVLKGLIKDGVKVDLTVTSPPYDNLRTYNQEVSWDFGIFEEIAKLLYGITVDGGVVVWVVNDGTKDGSKTGTSFRQALCFKEIGFNLHDVMIFAKKNPIPQFVNKRYTYSFEYMFILTKGYPKTFNPLTVPCKHAGEMVTDFKKKTVNDDTVERVVKNLRIKDKKIRDNIWYDSLTGKNYGHPAVFPYDLALEHILSWSNPTDLVLDPFMGSGTVGVACYELNRDFIGIEKVEKYFEISRERLKEVTEQQKLVW